MNINIRKINGNEYKLLNDFLYEAIFFLREWKHHRERLLMHQNYRFMCRILEHRKMIFVLSQK